MVTTARFLPVSLFYLQQVVLVALRHELRVELSRERDHAQLLLLQRVQGGSGECFQNLIINFALAVAQTAHL